MITYCSWPHEVCFALLYSITLPLKKLNVCLLYHNAFNHMKSSFPYAKGGEKEVELAVKAPIRNLAVKDFV